MNSEDAQKHLAFLKALVNEGPKAQKNAGELFLVAGVAYGVQCALNGLQILFQWPWPPLVWLIVGFAPTVIFLGWMFWMMWRERKDSQQGVATRALNAAYGSAGLTNLSMCVVLGWVSYTEQNFLIWLLYPAVVSALQGTCWYVAWTIRRKLWLGAVSAGWFATSVTLGFLITHVGYYLLVFTIALFALMAAPGYAMMRQEKAG